MPVDDLWFSSKRLRGPDGKLLPAESTKRHGRGKRYRVRWVDDTGQERSRLFDRKADADRWDANVRADVSRGQYIDPSAGKVTVEQYGEQWRAAQLHRDHTVDRIERTLRLHVYPTFGSSELRRVRPSQIQAWVRDRSKVLAPGSVKVTYQVVAGVFAAAVRDRLIGRTPCEDIRLPEVERSSLIIATPVQVHGLAAALPLLYRPNVYVAAGCGLRQGEVWGLELDHVDFLRREISVVHQLVMPHGKQPHLGPVKTATSKRTVELPQVTAESLAEHIRRHPPEGVEIDDLTDPRRPTRRVARLLFVSSRGNPMQRASWAYPWNKAVKAVGLPEGYGIHDLRHYFATLLIHAGASVKTVQLALGHATPMVTLNTYVHEWPEAIDRTRTLVDAALGKQSATPLTLAR